MEARRVRCRYWCCFRRSSKLDPMGRVGSLAAVGLVSLVLTCGRESTSPLAPEAGPPPETPGALEPASAGEIRQLIAALYPPPLLSSIAVLHFSLIQQQLRFGQTARARQSALIFMGIALRLDEAGLLRNPNGGSPPTTDEALARLFSLLLELVGLNPEGLEIPAGAFEPDGAFQICGPAGCTVVTGTQHAGVQLPPGAYDHTVFVAISRIPGSVGPLDTELDQYPLFYDIVILPEEDPAVLANVGLCVVDPPDPFAPDPDVVPRLRLAHPDPSGEGIEILPLVPVSWLECSDASTLASMTERLPRWARTALGPVVQLLEPASLYAGPGNLGGQASSFSPFAAVDTQPPIDEPPIDVGGTYEGIVTGRARQQPFERDVVVTLDQSDEAITGTFTFPDFSAGVVDGTVNGSLASFTFTQTTPCEGTFVGSATIQDSGDTLSGPFSGSSSCTGKIRANFLLTRISP